MPSMSKPHLATFVPLVLCSFIVTCCGRPPPPESNQCLNDHDKIAMHDGEGGIKCWPLKKCPHGFGLNFKFIPGKIYPYGTKTSCPSCIPGKTYSDKYDYSQCQDCTKCQENEISTGQCIIDKDTINCTGKCKDGFYGINSMCLSCSQCCGNGHDIKPPDCNVGTVSINKICSQETKKNCSSNATVAVNGDVNTPVKKHTKPPESNIGQFVILSTLSVFVVVTIVKVVGIVYNRWNHLNHHPGNVNCVEISTHENEGIKASGSSLDKPANNSVKVTEPIPVVLPGRDIEQQGNKKLNMIVIQIPVELYAKVCVLLDQLDEFYQDHRMLGNELGMATSDVENLGDNPTDKLLKQYNISVDCFLNMLKEIRGNSSQSHQNPRVDKAIELVESWLDK